MIVPAFMYPSLATQGAQAHNYSGKKMLFFIISAIIISMMLCIIGAALQHADLSNESINLCMSSVPTLAILLVDFLAINTAGQRITPGHLGNSLMVYIGFGLLVVPQFFSNIVNVIQDVTEKSQGLSHKDRRRMKGGYKDDNNLAEF